MQEVIQSQKALRQTYCEIVHKFHIVTVLESMRKMTVVFQFQYEKLMTHVGIIL